MEYCYKDLSGWHYETVKYTVMGQASPVASIVDSLDRFHVLYAGFDVTLFVTWMGYAYRDEQGWHFQNVAAPHFPWGSSDMALDDHLTPHVVFDYLGTLRHWYVGASGGEYENVDAEGNGDKAISISGTDQPSIVYNNEDSGELRYAVLGPLGWQIEVILDEETDVSSLSLVHNGVDEPYLSYHDNAIGALRLLKKTEANWIVETIDDVGDVGDHNSMAIDAAGYPHISYYDATNGDLKYAYEDDRGWQIVRVDTAGDVGKSTSIRLDEFGNVYFFYHDVTNNMIKYAYPALSASTGIVGESLVMNWSTVAGVSEYWIYGAENRPWFGPELVWPFGDRIYILDPLVTHYSTSEGIGDPESNWTYLVIAVDDQYQEIARSNRVGEWDWEMSVLPNQN